MSLIHIVIYRIHIEYMLKRKATLKKCEYQKKVQDYSFTAKSTVKIILSVLEILPKCLYKAWSLMSRDANSSRH